MSLRSFESGNLSADNFKKYSTSMGAYNTLIYTHPPSPTFPPFYNKNLLNLGYSHVGLFVQTKRKSKRQKVSTSEENLLSFFFSTAMTLLYRISRAPAPNWQYRRGLFFTHKNCHFGTVSVTKPAALRRSKKRTFTYWIGFFATFWHSVNRYMLIPRAPVVLVIDMISFPV